MPPIPWREILPPALSALRIAWTPTFPGARVGREIRKAIENLAAKLDDAGAKTGRYRPAVDFVRQAEIGRHLMNQVMLSFLCQPVNQEMAGSDQPSLANYLQLLNERDRLIVAWEHFFSDWDVLLCPVCGATAQPHGDETTTVDGNAVSQEAVNLPLRLATVTGNPSLVIPLGQDTAGLPIGAQLISARWQDERLLAMGARISDFTEGFCRPPGF